MFNFLKKPIENSIKAIGEISSYPKEVIEIHNEFNTAGDKLIAEACEIIEKAQAPEIDKAKRLSFLGFKQAKQVEESTTILKQAVLSEKVAELVKKYQVQYPNNKFITEEQVQAICFKYNLICGEVGKFRGFVPEKNLKQIEDFKNRYDIPQQARFTTWANTDEAIISLSDYTRKESSDYVWYEHTATGKHCFQQNIKEYDGIHYYGNCFKPNGNLSVNGRIEVIGLQICAPVKDMDMEGMTIKDGYKMRNIHVPDPVVLQPILGGYLILTAWGDEASDENVVNQNHN